MKIDTVPYKEVLNLLAKCEPVPKDVDTALREWTNKLPNRRDKVPQGEKKEKGDKKGKKKK